MSVAGVAQPGQRRRA